jgi:hypothetical protein
MALSGALLASPAFADEEHAFTLDIKDPEPIAPGTDGIITYELTNTSDEATDGFLINISIPPTVVLNLDADNCEKFDTNREGGDMVRCTFIGEIGQFAPGESKVLEKSYSVAADAPESASVGKIGANVVPIVAGEPTEDPTDIKGTHVDYAEITTSAGSAGGWDQLKAFFGF